MNADERPRASPPLSPCILICQLDASRTYCVGCQRTTAEIRDWQSLSEDAKRELLARLPARRRA